MSKRLLAQDSLRYFSKIPNEWTVPVRKPKNTTSRTYCTVRGILRMSTKKRAGFGRLTMLLVVVLGQMSNRAAPLQNCMKCHLPWREPFRERQKVLIQYR